MSNKYMPLINKGLSTAVVAVLLMEYGIPLAYETFTIVCMTILWTNILAVPLLWLFEKKKTKRENGNGQRQTPAENGGNKGAVQGTAGRG